MFGSPQIMDFIVQYDTTKFSLGPQTPQGDANTSLKHNSIYESTKYE
ncbi:hypothetical protein BAE44_0014656 [Dichanthelium oligosanthes]|uniref:Uncharacterized protein n=1 Tax=Dichanthelium oligosanthes TaxID=888268 RepID=A0A1E5VGV1_9POAL|nr:hypothetical protein BAE44_0014656 [Dichanthelium oligosanthes]